MLVRMSRPGRRYALFVNVSDRDMRLIRSRGLARYLRPSLPHSLLSAITVLPRDNWNGTFAAAVARLNTARYDAATRNGIASISFCGALDSHVHASGLPSTSHGLRFFALAPSE